MDIDEMEKIAAEYREVLIARKRKPLANRQAAATMADRVASPIGAANVLLEDELSAALRLASEDLVDGLGRLFMPPSHFDGDGPRDGG